MKKLIFVVVAVVALAVCVEFASISLQFAVSVGGLKAAVVLLIAILVVSLASMAMKRYYDRVWQ